MLWAKIKGFPWWPAMVSNIWLTSLREHWQHTWPGGLLPGRAGVLLAVCLGPAGQGPCGEGGTVSLSCRALWGAQGVQVNNILNLVVLLGCVMFYIYSFYPVITEDL